jgi:hypothetical protein
MQRMEFMFAAGEADVYNVRPGKNFDAAESNLKGRKKPALFLKPFDALLDFSRQRARRQNGDMRARTAVGSKVQAEAVKKAG